MNVGAAEINITPDFAVELSGFALRPQPSAGVADRIFARAIYLQGAGERLLWIACDLIAFERDFIDAFRAWAAVELGLEARQVLLSATHTHTAPATIHLTAAGRYSDPYVQLLRRKLEEVARRATAATEPCDLVSAFVPIELAIDRRGTASAHIDQQVSALVWKRQTGRGYVAACVNYAMHPVTFGRDFRMISGDWCGAVARRISAALAGNPVTLVSNGAAGNINPPRMDQPATVVEEYARTIGDAVLIALASAKTQAADRLVMRSITVPLPLDDLDVAGIDRAADQRLANAPPGWVLADPIREAVATWREKMKRRVAAGEGRFVPIELQAIRLSTDLGDAATIVTVNGEMFSRFTDYVRRATTPNLFVVAYANAAFGYIPTREAYAEGGYEVETAHFFYNSFRPKIGGVEMLAERAIELVKTLD